MMSVPMNMTKERTAPWRPPWDRRKARALRTVEGRVALIWEGRIVVLRPGERVFVGRGPDSRLRGGDPSLSWAHARVDVEPGRVRVTDLGSTNGLWQGGRRKRSAELVAGGVILIGRCPLLVGTPAPPPAPEGTAIWGDHWFRSRQMTRVVTQAALAAQVDAPVWIRGASGTGKEGLARGLHSAGPRAQGPWVALNCAALPETLAESELFGVVRGAFTGADRDRKGAFERAHGGTLFLDEVGELSPAIQAKLLRVVEERRVTPVGGSEPRAVDVRIVAATWVDLDREAAMGAFRFDLLQRISVLRLELSPLRKRPRDIAPIYGRFLHELGLDVAPLDAHVLAELEGRPWPGNARGLRAHALRTSLGALSELGANIGAAPPCPRRAAAEAVERYGGNRSRAARALGVSRSTLYRWLSSEVTGAPPELTPHERPTHDEACHDTA